MIFPRPYPTWYKAITVVFFVCPADAFAAQTITTAYGIPAVERIQVADISPQRLDQGRAGPVRISFINLGDETYLVGEY